MNIIQEGLSPLFMDPDPDKAKTGFEFMEMSVISETPSPTEKELRILREKVDPHRYLIGRDCREGDKHRAGWPPAPPCTGIQHEL